MPFQHQELASGRWRTLSLLEQLGNIGSEVHKMVMRGRDEAGVRAAFHRALELIDLTLDDPRHRGRLKEIARLRELLCDAAADRTYGTTGEDIDRYLMQFAVAARLRR